MNSDALSLFERIRSGSDKLSPAQKKVCGYILSHYRSLAYVTLAELARLTSTGQGTVVRFAQALGYGTFSNLQRALREEIEKSAPRSLEIYSSKGADNEDNSPFDIVFEMERSLMDETHSLINKEDFDHATKILSEAPGLVVSATGSNSFLADYAGYFLGTMKENVAVVKGTDLSDMNVILDAVEGTVGFVFSFPRYPIKTQTIISAMKEKGIRIIGISDSIASPIADCCSPFFMVPQKFMTFMDPCAAVMSLIHSILYGVWMRATGRGTETGSRQESVFLWTKRSLCPKISPFRISCPEG